MQQLKRDKRLIVRMAGVEVAMLERLAEADGINVSDYVRLFVRRAHAEIFGDDKSRSRR